MIFHKTITAVLDGRKTQTRRIVLPDEQAVLARDGEITHVLRANGRVRYAVGRTYAAVPKRTLPGSGYIRLWAIRLEDLQSITEEDAKAEGVAPARLKTPVGYVTSHRDAFEDLWNSLHSRIAHRWSANPPVWVLIFDRVLAPPFAR